MVTVGANVNKNIFETIMKIVGKKVALLIPYKMFNKSMIKYSIPLIKYELEKNYEPNFSAIT